MDFGEDFSVTHIGGLQGEGRIGGTRWLFSARHDQWWFSVGHDEAADGFVWIEPWRDSADCVELEESRALELVGFGVEAYRDPLARLASSLADGRALPAWTSDDAEIARAWNRSTVWVALASFAVRTVPEQRAVRESLHEFGCLVDEVFGGTPPFGTNYELVRVDDTIYAPSTHGVADETALRRLICERLRARFEPPSAAAVQRIAVALHRERADR